MADYVLTTQDTLARKPSTLTHIEAASLPIVGITAVQTLGLANASLDQGLRGKSVFVPAALSGTGSIGIQLAKRVFGAANVVTTASTAKVPKILDLLGADAADQIIDYTTSDPLKEVPRGSVDFMFDTIGVTFNYVSLLKPGTGLILSIASIPPSQAVVKMLPSLPFYIRYLLDLAFGFYRWRVGRWGVRYDGVIADIRTQDLDRLAKWVDEGNVRPVVGKTVRMDDLPAVREACLEVYQAHGGTGKTVIEVAPQS